MEPRIASGSYVLVWVWAKNYTVGDIVAVVIHNQVLIKRITYAHTDHIAVHGDNHTDSYDSNNFGLVPRSSILGKVVWY